MSHQPPPPPPPTFPPPPPPPTYPPPPPPQRFGPAPIPEPNLAAVPFTLACDLMLLSVALGISILMQLLVVTVWPSTVSPQEKQMLEWMPFWAILTTAVGYLLGDGWRCLVARDRLPFQKDGKAIASLYWQRFELILGTVAAHLLLICLCLLLTQHPFFSKLFLTITVSLFAFFLGRSMPTKQLALIATTGVFSFAMLIIAIAAQIGG